MSWSRSAHLIALVGLWLVLLALLVTPQPAAAVTTYKTYAAYKTAVGARNFLASNPRNPRLLTDAQFMGQLDTGTALLGMYYGNQGWEMEQVRDMESWQNKKHAILNMVTSWCNEATAMDNLFEQQLMNIWNNQNVPMITWEPFLCSPSRTPQDVEVQAARGTYDAYFNTWAERLKGFLSGPDGVYNSRDDRRVYLRMGHEMNGDWYPWSGAAGRNSPADYVNMWKRVKGIFDGKGLDRTHVQWVWCVNHTDNGGFMAEEYYPGDGYVDWVAIDGYNWGETQSWSDWKAPPAVYGDMIRRLRAFTAKPLAIPEFATTSWTTKGSSALDKSQWIMDVHEYIRAQDVRMVAWFNEDKETDWAVFGGSGGDGSYTVTPFNPRIRLWQIVGTVLLAVFIMAEVVFVTRLI